MKKRMLLFLAGLLVALAIGSTPAMAQKKDYFSGKWDVTIKDTPMGDSKLTVVMARINKKLTGYIINKDGDKSAIEKIEEKNQVVTIYFTFNHFDVDLTMQKKDENHFTGKLKDRYVSEGVRLKK